MNAPGGFYQELFALDVTALHERFGALTRNDVVLDAVRRAAAFNNWTTEKACLVAAIVQTHRAREMSDELTRLLRELPPGFQAGEPPAVAEVGPA